MFFQCKNVNSGVLQGQVGFWPAGGPQGWFSGQWKFALLSAEASTHPRWGSSRAGVWGEFDQVQRYHVLGVFYSPDRCVRWSRRTVLLRFLHGFIFTMCDECVLCPLILIPSIRDFRWASVFFFSLYLVLEWDDWSCEMRLSIIIHMFVVVGYDARFNSSCTGLFGLFGFLSCKLGFECCIFLEFLRIRMLNPIVNVGI